MMKYTYLDHNATSSLLTEVKNAMVSLLGITCNPSSIHSLGRGAKSIMEASRNSILAALHASADKYSLVFTSSGTEANNLFIHNFTNSHLFVSSIEHDSIMQPSLSTKQMIKIRVDHNGLLDLDHLEAALAQAGPGNKIVSVMYANNETGVIQNMKAIARIAHRYNALLHSDAVQAFGKIDINLANLDIDLITISSHKCGGPVGAAALLYKKSIVLHSQMMGGGQERGLRSGTENIAAIAGIGKVADLITVINDQYTNIRKLRDLLESKILLIAPEVKIFSRSVPRLPNTTCFIMPRVASDVQLIHFDLSGFAVSAGAACSSGKVKTSSVLLAMDVGEDIANTAIRVSLGISNTVEEVNNFITVWQSVYKRLSAADKNDNFTHHDFNQLDNINYVH
ncbi:MAG: cysteine desulfurase family protein [Alphaproteobacteria bacterium]|jgi:cysteine desulfurase